jgi:hypothetical protein
MPRLGACPDGLLIRPDVAMRQSPTGCARNHAMLVQELRATHRRRYGMTNSSRSLIAGMVVLGGLFATVSAQSARPTERFHALAVQLGAPQGQTTLPVDLSITRWSTSAERDTLLATLLEQPRKLVEVLQKMPAVGRLGATGNVGYELRYAQKTSSGGTDRIVLITDRPVGFVEAATQPRTIDYPITVIELRVGPSGKGEGKVAVAAKLAADTRTKDLVIEDWNISPVLLQGLERDKR